MQVVAEGFAVVGEQLTIQCIVQAVDAVDKVQLKLRARWGVCKLPLQRATVLSLGLGASIMKCQVASYY